MVYDKLVRDKIPELLMDDGKTATIRRLKDEEYQYYLEKKLDEEVAEYHESKNLEELADILEVICELVTSIHCCKRSVFDAKCSVKRLSNGGFDSRICLLEIKED